MENNDIIIFELVSWRIGSDVSVACLFYRLFWDLLVVCLISAKIFPLIILIVSMRFMIGFSRIVHLDGPC